MAVGVVWGTEFVVVAAVFVTGVVAGAVCDLMLALSRHETVQRLRLELSHQ